MVTFSGRFAPFLTLLLGFATAAAPGPVIVLRTGELAPYKAVEQAFEAALGQPTQSVSLASGAPADVVKGVLAKSPALIFAIGTDAAKAVQDAAPSAPLLYALVPSPGRLGLNPRAGVPMFAAPLAQVKVIKSVIPKAIKVGMIYDAKLSKPFVDECESAASSQGMKLVRKEVSSQKEVLPIARDLFAQVDVFWLIPDTTVVSVETFKFITLTSLESKVPLVGFSEAMAKNGAVLAVEARYDEIGRKAAAAAKRVLGGAAVTADAADGAVFVNARSAQLMDINVPASIKASAAKVYE